MTNIQKSFDKTADEFCVSGRKYLLKYWMIEGMASEINGITREVRETDEHEQRNLFKVPLLRERHGKF